MLEELIERSVVPLGFELVDFEFQPRPGLMRVFIDRPEGVTVDDCARVSNHLSRVFAVEEVDYHRLEVSSPGLDRPLRKLADFARFAGHEAQVRLRDPVDGSRKLTGVLRGTDGTLVQLDMPDGRRSIPFETIAKARLKPQIAGR